MHYACNIKNSKIMYLQKYARTLFAFKNAWCRLSLLENKQHDVIVRQQSWNFIAWLSPYNVRAACNFLLINSVARAAFAILGLLYRSNRRDVSKAMIRDGACADTWKQYMGQWHVIWDKYFEYSLVFFLLSFSCSLIARICCWNSLTSCRH